MKTIKKAVIPAAGFGTRFLPVTKTIAKEMFPIVDTPAIEYIINEALDSGVEEFVIIISDNKQAIVEYFQRNYKLEEILTKNNKTKELQIINDLNKIKVTFVKQEEQLGLGHAVLCAKEVIGNEDFALLLGDDVYVGNNEHALKQLINQYKETTSTILGTLKVDKKDTNKYGICEYINKTSNDRLNQLKSVVEKPNTEDAPSDNAIGGRYILTNTIFKYLENQTSGKGGEIQLTDAILRLMSEEKVYSYQIDGKWYDLGSKIGYIEAIIDFSLKREDLRDDVKQLLKNKQTS